MDIIDRHDELESALQEKPEFVEALATLKKLYKEEVMTPLESEFDDEDISEHSDGMYSNGREEGPDDVSICGYLWYNPA